MLVSSTSRSHDASRNATDRVHISYYRSYFLNFALRHAPTTGLIEAARPALHSALQLLEDGDSSPGALHMQVKAIRKSDIFKPDAMAVLVSAYDSKKDNKGNTTSHRERSAADTLSHDALLAKKLDGSDFFLVLGGRGDEQELPADGTLIGDYPFKRDSFVPLSYNAGRERTNARNLKNNTGHSKAIRFLEFTLQIFGTNEGANIVAVRFIPRETESPLTPKQHVDFVRDVEAFVESEGDPDDTNALLDYLASNTMKDVPFGMIAVHLELAKGAVPRDPRARRLAPLSR